ncbi:MFS transporter [Pseudanabaena sp. FACHB-2040]|uniref:MFS transporter n=1 Tax=Pseudanabaena sp. FACHB-2040 TaxID=2692859 RepID=UPI0016874A8E|nr:MFS transporter [Pseudanabaena sp. FACHB-2040]MBD2256704.1 MFS transporter [Pseudanabaena sp. FACHB-2040]
MDLIPAETPLAEELLQIKVGRVALPLVLDTEPKVAVPPQEDKDSIRDSLQASTLDGLFATIFTTTTGGVLLSNLLVELQASPTQIGLLASIPMLANLLQPLGAYLSNRSRSRRWYNLVVYTLARLPWFGLVGGIAIAALGHLSSDQLVMLTLSMVFFTSFIGALGSASWLSWLAALVPHRLRGRYFGFRNSVASLTSLIAIPIGGLIVSRWPGGTLQGYGLVLMLGIAAGFVSLAFQALMMDVDPQEQIHLIEVGKRRGKGAEAQRSGGNGEQRSKGEAGTRGSTGAEEASIWQNGNFLRFLVYFAVWMFAVNLSAPFFNLYLLDNLGLDVSLVTLYNSLSAGANLLLLLVWGRIADRMGNRFLLLLVGIIVAVTPILWLATGPNTLSLVLWLPLLHMLGGGTWAAIDLCNNNLQMGIAPMRHHASYFAIAAAIAGVSGALGTTAGGFLAETPRYGGILGVFALSSVLRLIALLPLVFVREGRSIRQVFKTWLPLPGGRLIPFAYRAVGPQLPVEQSLPDPPDE